MKKICAGVMIIGLMVASKGFSQEALMTVVPVSIEATVTETTSLIFPFEITTADWGSDGIIVQPIKVVKNILRVKAARRDFVPTNLSVITADGNFYAFKVEYDSAPAQLNYLVQLKGGVGVAKVTHNELTLQQEGELVRYAPSFLHVSKKALLTRLQLKGAYIGQQAMWLKMNLSNRSWMNFPVGYVRFFVKDRRVIKRRVTQEKEISTVYSDTISQINGKGNADLIYGFAPFTILRNQRLVVQVAEKGEGRFTELKVPSRDLLRARKIMR